MRGYVLDRGLSEIGKTAETAEIAKIVERRDGEPVGQRWRGLAFLRQVKGDKYVRNVVLFRDHSTLLVIITPLQNGSAPFS